MPLNRWMISAFLASGAAPLALLGSCASDGSGSEEAAAAEPVDAEDIAGMWTLSRMEGRSVPLTVRAPTLTIDAGGLVTGHAGVNQLSTSFAPAELRRGGIAFGPVITTKMAGPPEAMDVERRFLEAMSRIDGVRVDGDLLTLMTGADALLEFRRAAH